MTEFFGHILTNLWQINFNWSKFDFLERKKSSGDLFEQMMISNNKVSGIKASCMLDKPSRVNIKKWIGKKMKKWKNEKNEKNEKKENEKWKMGFAFSALLE